MLPIGITATTERMSDDGDLELDYNNDGGENILTKIRTIKLTKNYSRSTSSIANSHSNVDKISIESNYSVS